MAEERAAFLISECNQAVFSFAAHFSRLVEASFTAGQVTSYGAALLLSVNGYPNRFFQFRRATGPAEQYP
jgi:hypothetical protein